MEQGVGDKSDKKSDKKIGPKIEQNRTKKLDSKNWTRN